MIMESKKIHIGKMVEAAFNQSGMSKVNFARALGILPQNVNREFDNADWSVIKLIKAGRILNFDFSPLFKIDGEIPKTQKQRVLLQIEIEDDKIDYVLKAIKDKQLYNILRQE